ncbi:MAG: hypothetical protein ACOYMG_21005, partial [Candidatus Methylumidiphilus sp.]
CSNMTSHSTTPVFMPFRFPSDSLKIRFNKLDFEQSIYLAGGQGYKAGYSRILFFLFIRRNTRSTAIAPYRVDAQAKNGKAIVCAAMRKMVHIAFAILKSGEPFDSEFKLTKGAS